MEAMPIVMWNDMIILTPNFPASTIRHINEMFHEYGNVTLIFDERQEANLQ